MAEEEVVVVDVVEEVEVPDESISEPEICTVYNIGFCLTK